MAAATSRGGRPVATPAQAGREAPEEDESQEKGCERKTELKSLLAKRRQVVDDEGDHFESEPGTTNTPTRTTTQRPSWGFTPPPPSLPSPPTPSEPSGASISSPPRSWGPSPLTDSESTPPSRTGHLQENCEPSIAHEVEGPLTSVASASGRGRSQQQAEHSVDSHAAPSRGKSAPPPGSLYDELPKYPELRKRRSLGDRPSGLQVRFAETPRSQSSTNDESDQEDNSPRALSVSNIALKNRRISRGPRGDAYRVRREVSDDCEESSGDEKDSSVSPEPDEDAQGGNYGAAVVGGLKGIAYGGIVGGTFGVIPAVFTLGLSIPMGAALGAATQGYQGFIAGAATGSGHDTPSGSRSRSTSRARSKSRDRRQS